MAIYFAVRWWKGLLQSLVSYTTPSCWFLWQFLASVYHGMVLKFHIWIRKTPEYFSKNKCGEFWEFFLGGGTSVFLDLNVGCCCALYFFKATYLCLEKSQFQKTIYELYLVWKRPSTLYCANTPYVTGFFAQEKTELQQLWIEFFTRLKSTAFKNIKDEKKIICWLGEKYIKTRLLLLITPKEKEELILFFWVNEL